MNDPLAVGHDQSIDNVAQNADGIGEGERARCQLVAQRGPRHVGHDVVQETIGLAGVVQGEDVRVLQPGDDLDFPKESLGAERRSQFGTQDLERHFPVVLDIIGQIDRGHASAPQFPLDGVAVLKCVGDLG